MSEEFKNLLGNDEFISKLENSKNDEDTLALFKEYGIDLTIETLKAMLSEGNNELDENELDEVAGGGIGGYIIGRMVASWLRSKYSSGSGKGGKFSSGGGSGGGGGGGHRF